MSAQVPMFHVYHDGDKIKEAYGPDLGEWEVGVSPLLSSSLTYHSIPQLMLEEANSSLPPKSVIQIKSLEKFNAAVRSTRTVPCASS
jgi:hypothetical protein